MKLGWERGEHNKSILYAVMLHDNGVATPTGLREEHLKPVQAWCEGNNCGVRLAFDMFSFKTEEDMTTFLLRWS